MSAPRSLTPEQRSLRSRIAAYALHAGHDSRALTANARAASPGSLTYWEQQVDPGSVLDGRERARRAEQKRKEHFARLAYASSRARQARITSKERS